MRVEFKNVAQLAEIQAEPDTTITVTRDDDGRYTLRIHGGGRVAAVIVHGLGELQLRQLASTICLQI